MIRRRARAQAGTASVEIVVMLPVMIILFAAVYHLYSLGRAELTTSQSARACVWQYAIGGCRAEGSLCKPGSVKGEQKAEEKSPGQSKEPEPEDTRFKNAKATHTSKLEKLADIPVVKQIVEFMFGEVASAHASTNVQQFRSEEQSKVQNSLYLVCNTVSESWGDKITSSLCSMVKKVVGKGVPGCK